MNGKDAYECLWQNSREISVILFLLSQLLPFILYPYFTFKIQKGYFHFEKQNHFKQITSLT